MQIYLPCNKCNALRCSKAFSNLHLSTSYTKVHNTRVYTTSTRNSRIWLARSWFTHSSVLLYHFYNNDSFIDACMVHYLTKGKKTPKTYNCRYGELKDVYLKFLHSWKESSVSVRFFRTDELFFFHLLLTSREKERELLVKERLF